MIIWCFQICTTDFRTKRFTRKRNPNRYLATTGNTMQIQRTAALSELTFSWDLFLSSSLTCLEIKLKSFTLAWSCINKMEARNHSAIVTLNRLLTHWGNFFCRTFILKRHYKRNVKEKMFSELINLSYNGKITFYKFFRMLSYYL